MPGDNSNLKQVITRSGEKLTTFALPDNYLNALQLK